MVNEFAPTPNHLKQATELWNLDSKVEFHRHLANYVYFSQMENVRVVLRLTPHDLRKKEEVDAEIKFQLFLHQSGLRVTTPIKSHNGNVVEIIDSDGRLFYAVLFNFIDSPRPSDEETLNPAFLKKWGSYTGKMHLLSAQCSPVQGRSHWHQDSILLFAKKFLPNSPKFVQLFFDKSFLWMKSLPETPYEYGLLHGDFHRGNFFIVDGEIVGFDFDDATHSWFMLDIATIMTTINKILKTSDEQQKALDAFISGYKEHKEIGAEWMHRYPQFYGYRIVVVYLWMNAMIAQNKFSDTTIQSWKEVEPWYLNYMLQATSK